MKTGLGFIFLAFAIFLSACASRAPDPPRWVPNTVRTVTFATQRAAFETALSFLRGRGYDIVDLDEGRFYIRAKAKLDNDVVIHGGGGPHRVVERVSFLSFEAHPDGRLTIAASGYHIRDNETVMHHKLAEEIDGIVAGLKGQ